MFVKRLISILLVCVMFLSTLAISVAAATENPHHDPIIEEYIVSCPGGSKHQMHPKGAGTVYSGNKNGRLIYGFTSQCSVCLIALISDQRPWLSGTFGYYYLFNPGDYLANYGTIVNNVSSVSYFGGSVYSDSYWSGYTFYSS